MSTAAIHLDPDNIVWQPYKKSADNSGSQDAFLSCPAREVILHGTRGGGKSDCLLMDFLQHVGQGYGSDWVGVIFRKSFPQLGDIIMRSHRWIPRIFPGAKYNGTDYKWTFPQGEVLMFSYLARETDYENWHGKQLPWQGYDELCNWSDLKIYEKMMTCCRSSNPDVPRKIRSTANPSGPGHNAVKRHFKIGEVADRKVFDIAETTRCGIFSRIEDNIALMSADPEYAMRLDALLETNPVFYRAWRLGDWDVVAGGAFDDIWDPTIHVVDPFHFPSSWHIDRSFDWGSSAPFACLWHAESDGSEFDLRTGFSVISTTPQEYRRCYPKGTLFTFAEWFGANERAEGLRMTNHDIARGIKDREEFWEDHVEEGPADSAIFDVVNNTSIAEEMQAVGVRWDRANKQPGSRINGFQVMRNMLLASTRRPMEDQGWFLVRTHSRFPGYGCPKLIEQLPTLTRDEKNIEDVNSDQEDHLYDCARYRINSKRNVYTVQGM